MVTANRLPAMHFLRDFHMLRGGHRKVWDYFEHVNSTGRYEPAVFFTPNSVVDDTNPWVAAGSRILDSWTPQAADALFLGALDWLAVPEQVEVPVLNLVQSVQHVDPRNRRYPFLRRRAFRVCITDEVADAVRSSGQANGPIVTVPLGLAHEQIPLIDLPRTVDVVIAGIKNIPFAEQLAQRLATRGISVECHTRWAPRSEITSSFARCRVAVTLPAVVEGFYLPALEATARGCIVVCPRADGTSAYQNGVHALRPAYEFDDVVSSVQEALALEPSRHQAMLQAGADLVRKHSLDEERSRFAEVLEAFSGSW